MKENMFRNIEPKGEAKQPVRLVQADLGEIVLIPVTHAQIPELRRTE